MIVMAVCASSVCRDGHIFLAHLLPKSWAEQAHKLALDESCVGMRESSCNSNTYSMRH